MILPLTSLGGLIFFGGWRVGVPMMEDPRIIQANDLFFWETDGFEDLLGTNMLKKAFNWFDEW